jgi:hypothetical protein
MVLEAGASIRWGHWGFIIPWWKAEEQEILKK